MIELSGGVVRLFGPITRTATAFPLRCVPVPRKAAATFAPALGSSTRGRMTPLPPSSPAFRRIASSISDWLVHSPEPVASMIATRT